MSPHEQGCHVVQPVALHQLASANHLRVGQTVIEAVDGGEVVAYSESLHRVSKSALLEGREHKLPAACVVDAARVGSVLADGLRLV